MKAKGIENRSRRKYLGSKDENGEWRRFHNEEIHNLYRSPNTARMIKSRRLDGQSRMEEGKFVFKILTGKATGKRPIGGPRLR